MIRQIVIGIVAFALGYGVSYFTTSASVTKTIIAKSSVAEVKRVDNKLKANQKAGDSVEQKRRQIDAVFTTLEKEAAHDAPHDIDDCELPADRLHRWRAANAGTLERFAADEHDAGTEAAATARERQGTHAGGKSPGCGQALPPVGNADLRANPLDGN